MNSERNDRTNLINQARELLSPYLDNEVTAAERTLVESMLAESPELQQELAGLRQTVDLLGNMPAMAGPRSFTLTEADVGLAIPAKMPFWHGWFKPALGAAAALIAVVIVGVYLFNTQQSENTSSEIANLAAPQAQSAAGQVEEAQPAAESLQEFSVSQPQPAQDAASEEAPAEPLTATDSSAVEPGSADQDALRSTTPAAADAAELQPVPTPTMTPTPAAQMQAAEAPAATAAKVAESEGAAMESQADQPISEAAPANPAAQAAPPMAETEMTSTEEQTALPLQPQAAADSAQTVESPPAEEQSEDAADVSAGPVQTEKMSEAAESQPLTSEVTTPAEAVEPPPAPLVEEDNGRNVGGVGGGGQAVGAVAGTEADEEPEAFNPFLKVALIITAIFLAGAIMLGIFSWSSPRKP